MKSISNGISFSVSPIPIMIVIDFFRPSSSASFSILVIGSIGFEGQTFFLISGLMHSTAPQTPSI